MPNLLCCKSATSYFASANAVNQYAPNTVIEPKHLDIQLKLNDLHDKRLTATVTITFGYGGQALIRDREELSSVTLNAEGFEQLHVEGASHSYDGHRIQLHWPEPFEKNTQRNVTVSYKVEHPIAGLYFQNEDSLMNDKECCWAITDHETEKARYWLPTIDFPTARTTLTWAISAPSQYTSLANGALISEQTENGYTTTRWKLDYPCPSYLVCFAVGDFVSVDAGQVDGKPVKYYTARGYASDDLERSFGKTPDMIKWLEAKVGVPFPWPKYYQIALPAIRGAMENISLVTWTDMLVLDKINAKERQYIVDIVNVHEMAHTYFGDLLVIRHFEHAWLKESWATYMESCWLQDNLSEDDFRFEMLTNAHGYMKECNKDYMRPIVTRMYDSSWDMFDSHTYPGGAWRIHMLRAILGDEAFWAGVKHYVEKFSTKTVQTSDFQASLEWASGLNLTRFFDEWLYSKGYPMLKGNFNHDLSRGLVEVSITQTQVDGDVPLFSFDLDIELTDDKGNKYENTIKFDRDATRVTTFVLCDKGTLPSMVRVDPHFRVLHTLDMSTDQRVLENTATQAEDVPSRIWAYNELIKNGSYSALKFIQDHILQEQFYGVRAQVSALLAKQKSGFALKILASMVKKETEPLAMSTVITACQIQDDTLREAILDVLSRADQLPYRAHAAALVALAVQQNDADLQYLLRVAQDDAKIGQHGLIRAGALKALGYHRSEEGFKYLISRVGYNIEPMRARAQALEGLKYSAEWQEKQLQRLAVETFAKLLRDPNLTVRTVAVDGLVALEARHIYNDVEGSRYLYSKDDQSWLDRKLYELYQSRSSAPDRSTKEHVDKLEERVRKLEEKLQQLDQSA
ncbi:peptidase family M1-domain-containing protein [Zychaea mexicana]|uniref:peptidase family M1-domain-containing protein n=1 Tax=Zychaea mexicana TaxID=64656 RepID=UPI0022FEEAB7|nr:peptidase family M1-domain-containing protein [Zychaea mexicana]KAI9494934.1 peptidase family M1-domain-containing protein [Zychaea mexicana]